MKTLGIRGKTVIAVAIVAALVGLMSWSAAPAGAQQGEAKPVDEAGHVVVYTVDWADSSGLSFATFLKSGEVIADGLRVTDDDSGVIGDGHGMWRYRQQDRSLFVRTLHTDVQDTTQPAVYQTTFRLMHDSGAQFKGKATIEKFSSLEDFRAGMPPVSTRTLNASATFDPDNDPLTVN